MNRDTLELVKQQTAGTSLRKFGRTIRPFRHNINRTTNRVFRFPVLCAEANPQDAENAAYKGPLPQGANLECVFPYLCDDSETVSFGSSPLGHEKYFSPVKIVEFRKKRVVEGDLFVFTNGYGLDARHVMLRVNFVIVVEGLLAQLERE